MWNFFLFFKFSDNTQSIDFIGHLHTYVLLNSVQIHPPPLMYAVPYLCHRVLKKSQLFRHSHFGVVCICSFQGRDAQYTVILFLIITLHLRESKRVATQATWSMERGSYLPSSHIHEHLLGLPGYCWSLHLTYSVPQKSQMT